MNVIKSSSRPHLARPDDAQLPAPDEPRAAGPDLHRVGAGVHPPAGEARAGEEADGAAHGHAVTRRDRLQLLALPVLLLSPLLCGSEHA